MHIQVTVQYKKEGNDLIPMFVHTIVISAMHQKGIPLSTQKEELKEKVVKVYNEKVFCACIVI